MASKTTTIALNRRFLASGLLLVSLVAGCAELPMVGSRGGAVPAELLEAGILSTSGVPPQRFAALQAKRAESSIPRGDALRPEIFEVTDTAVWDGKPSHGRIWIEVPNAFQPERVEISHPETGLTVRGAMFVRRDLPAGLNSAPVEDAPIRLSSGAAEALGLDPNAPATLRVTALRRIDPNPMAPPQIARRASTLGVPEGPARAPELDSDIWAAPALEPEQFDGRFVQVAEAVDPDAALDVLDRLTAADITAELQEDLLGGAPYFRVFADARVAPETLSIALDTIRFAVEEESAGDVSGALIAELPNFTNLWADDLPSDLGIDVEPGSAFAGYDADEAVPVWTETGRFLVRNEAMAVVQRLTRRAVPTILCSTPTGKRSAIHRVFAGSLDAEPFADEAAFCAGVVAAGTAPPALQPVAAISVQEVDLPPRLGDAAPNGPVRIRVGEATGGLNLSVPEPFTDPIRMTVSGVGIALPQGTPSERIKDVIEAIEALD